MNKSVQNLKEQHPYQSCSVFYVHVQPEAVGHQTFFSREATLILHISIYYIQGRTTH